MANLIGAASDLPLKAKGEYLSTRLLPRLLHC